MLKISETSIKNHTKLYVESIKSSSRVALMYDDFISNTLHTLYDDVPFPEEIRVVRPEKEAITMTMQEMIDNPAHIIKKPPPSIFGLPVWRGNTKKGIMLRGAGYVNGDSRKLCQIALDDSTPHGILAGATGHGKSVTLTSIIETAALEYPPWEVKFVLVDAKIVEMKAYALNSIMPHISSVAATEDAEYIISVLQNAYEEMMLRNSVFSKVGVMNIGDFREKTGLVMPHVLIIIDEFQTMFANAAKKGKYINELITKVARLGRNTGYHIFPASQSLGDELDKGALGNIGVRLCLGCMPDVSVKVLGNPQASINYKCKGRLIINNNPANGKIDENLHLVTPFLPGTPIGSYHTLFDYMAEVEKTGFLFFPNKNFQTLSFYDEEAKVFECEYKSYISQKPSPHIFYLGEPSFVLNDPDGEKWLRLDLRPDDPSAPAHLPKSLMPGQNILIFSPIKLNRDRYIKMLEYNLIAQRDKNISFKSLAFYSSSRALNSVNIGIFDKVTQVSEYSSEFVGALRAGYWRKLLKEADDLAFGNIKIPDSFKDEFNSISNGAFTGELWYKRTFALKKLLQTASFKSSFGISKLSNKELDAAYLSIIRPALRTYISCNCVSERVTLNTFDTQYIWVLGLEDIVNLGREGKTSNVNEFQRIVRDSSIYGIHFIVSTSTLEEITQLRGAFEHIICDNLTTSQITQLKVGDYYPDIVSSGLGVYYTPTSENEDKCRKFKKMKFEGEL